MNNQSIIKAEEWFNYYKKIYSIYKDIVLKKQANYSIQLSFCNYIPEEDYEYIGKGQIVKLELFNGATNLSGISLKTTDSEEMLFQYIWMLTVNHFIVDNYSKSSKIRIYSPDNSTRGFKYLISNQTVHNNAIARANFYITYNKEEYDEMLHIIILNHNNYNEQNLVMINNIRNYIMNNSNNSISTELNSSLNKSRKTYEHLIHNNHFAA